MGVLKQEKEIIGMKTFFFTMAYNAEQTIARTISSIQRQTRADWEYYILDNGSIDHTGDIITEYAKSDLRIKPIFLRKNDPGSGGAFFGVLALASNPDYLVWCDADDTYSADFLEKMINFVEEFHLDIAVCGYDRVDGATNQILKRRVLEEDLIIYGDKFVSEFIQYRGFTITPWGKLFAVPFLKSIMNNAGSKEGFRYLGDSMWMLWLFKDAKRVGVFHQAMYQWYQYPNSLSRTNLHDNIKNYPKYFDGLKWYLEQYGPISKVNEDFLYAIYMSLMEEGVEFIFQVNLPVKKQLELLRELFEEVRWAETLARDADPQFRNLAARGEFVRQMTERVMALAASQEERSLAEAVVREIDKLPKKLQ